MAIHEHDREDLLGEGRNMPWRGECFLEGTKIVVGFRPQGQVSLFCGADPVFQFNGQHELRRAYEGGVRYRAERGRLVAMTRRNRGGKLTFETRVIEPQLQARLLDTLQNWLARIQQAIDRSDWRGSDWRVEGESVESFQSRLRAWFAALPDRPTVAERPNA